LGYRRAGGGAQGQTRPSARRTNPARRGGGPNAPAAKCRRLDTAGLALQREGREQREGTERKRRMRNAKQGGGGIRLQCVLLLLCMLVLSEVPGCLSFIPSGNGFSTPFPIHPSLLGWSGGGGGGSGGGGGACQCKDRCEIFMGRDICYVRNPGQCDRATPSIRVTSHLGEAWIDCPY